MKSKIKNLFSLLLEVSEEVPDGIFFIYRGTPVSYRDSLLISQKFASYLLKRGIKKNDRVLLFIGNVPEFIYSYFAIAQIGAIAVLINPIAKRYELKYYIEETTPKIIITKKKELDNFKENDSSFYSLSNIILIDELSNSNGFWNQIEHEKPKKGYEELEPDHASAIIYTSAMDGFPLGAMLTHNSIFTAAVGTSKLWIEEGDVFLSVLPLFHAFGLTATLIIPLYGRLPFYLMDKFSPKGVLELITKGNCNTFCGVPIMYNLLSRIISQGTKFPWMRSWISGGEALPLALQRDMNNRFNIEIREGYGLTEASPNVTWNYFGIPNKFGSIGLPLPYNRVKIIKNEREAESNEDGEIVIKGSNVIPCYFNRDDKTMEIIKDGWLYTGDIGRFDDDGYFYITGMKKDMVINNGFNVYPKEIERILRYHPSISDVHITINREKNGKNIPSMETIEATIYRKDGHTLDQESLLDWCKENISFYKIPQNIHMHV